MVNHIPETELSYKTKAALTFYSNVIKFWRQTFKEALDDKSVLEQYYQKLLELDLNQQLRKEKRVCTLSVYSHSANTNFVS